MTYVTERFALNRTDPMTTRRALRAEKAQLTRWRRLVRARLDLAVAAFAPPDALGEMNWDIVPEAQLTLPMPEALARAVAVPPPVDPVALMEHLRALDRVLAAYGRELDAALEESTLAEFHRLAGQTSSMDGAVAR